MSDRQMVTFFVSVELLADFDRLIVALNESREKRLTRASALREIMAHALRKATAQGLMAEKP